MPPSAAVNLPIWRCTAPCEGALLVAEQLGLDQFVGNRGAVDLHERQFAARAAGVDGTRHQFLADAALPGDQHGGRGRRDALNCGPKLLHRGGLAHQLERRPTQQPVLVLEALALDGVAKRQEYAVPFERLLEEVVGPQPGRLDRGGDVSVTADHHHRHVMAALPEARQRGQTIHSGHLDVQHNGRRRPGHHASQRLSSRSTPPRPGSARTRGSSVAKLRIDSSSSTTSTRGPMSVRGFR